MRNARKYVHTGWLFKRLDKLPNAVVTHEVARILKISVRTLQRWTTDPYFKKHQIAVQHGEGKGTRYIWSREKLRVWLRAVYEDESNVAMNPGGAIATSARVLLGMPPNYSVRLGREKIAGDTIQETDE